MMITHSRTNIYAKKIAVANVLAGKCVFTRNTLLILIVESVHILLAKRLESICSLRMGNFKQTPSTNGLSLNRDVYRFKFN